ncbi:hypothetical protein FHS57_006019 [Runella defluvii]|uniref:Uncharacterized protein n=1 Tax=Runella defluvii TaxID=370973 RepID=A0A7W5ZSL5_9BACT|nr:hypothetical protein [Runella defluvii]MBB3841990.1 hypothetical protein [Runella defluvii]
MSLRKIGLDHTYRNTILRKALKMVPQLPIYYKKSVPRVEQINPELVVEAAATTVWKKSPSTSFSIFPTDWTWTMTKETASP